MKITNNTDFITSDLSKIFRECLKQEGMGNNIRFICEKRRANGRRWGCASWGGNRVTLYLEQEQDKKELLNILKHELAHLRGVGHDEMKGGHFIVDFGSNDWVESYELKHKEIKGKPKRDIQLERYQNALKNLKQNQTKLKRAETLVKKWKSKVKYYEKKSNQL